MQNHKTCYYPLTHPQKRIWYIDKINTNSPLHNIGGCMKINENIDVDMLKESLNLVVKANEGLRLRLIESNGFPVQYIHPFIKQNIDFKDFSGYDRPIEEHRRWSASLFEKNFNLNDSQLYYFAIYKISENQYGVLLNIHHIIADGWSLSLIQKQTCEFYSRLMNNEEIGFAIDSSYTDYIYEEEEYLTSERFLKNKNFWHEKYKNISEECLYRTANSLRGIRLPFKVETELSKRICRYVEEQRCSLNTFFIAVLLIFLNKTTQKNDFVIGTPVFNRTSKKQKATVGMFTSTVPCRFNIDADFIIEDLIKLVNKELKLCYMNQKYPYDLLVKDLALSNAGYDSLFKMCVNYYNTQYIKEINGIDISVEEYYSGNQSYSMQMTVKEWEANSISLNFDYKTEEYTEEEIRVMYQSIINITRQLLSQTSVKIKDINLISQEETRYKLYELNSMISSYPNKTVHELFEEQVEKTPDKVSLEFNETELTYKELNEKANQLSDYLRHNHVKKGSIVGIMMSHSMELVIGIIGIMKTGGVYLPIDPGYPMERIHFMLEDSACEMLLTDFEDDKTNQFVGRKANIKNIELSAYSKQNITKCVGLNDLVYILYTSGSTGKPKGVMIEHRGLTNYIWWAKKMYLRNNEEAMALYSSIAFDLTVTSIFAPLVSGNKILIYGNDENEYVLFKILNENKATAVKLTPAHLTLLKNMDNSRSNIRTLIVGGEDLKAKLAKEIYNSFGKKIEIYNEYGPTETVVGCMIHLYSQKNDNGISVPIGRPADNVQIYILDNQLQVVPDTVIGELYISGDGVARGYLNKEELTLEKFIDNPFIKGRKMYKSGDTARYRKDGVIEFVSRDDSQVKIRGHRVELGEIEKYLLDHEVVKDTVVLYKADSLGSKSLNAYIVCKAEVNDDELLSWLSGFLPQYMIPANFIRLERLPLTSNGKIDYAALPEPQQPKKEFVSYKTDVEKELVKAMEEVLGVDNISMNDNYHKLGGDSIKAIQISSKLKGVGLDIRVKDILSYDAIQQIASAVEFSKSKRTISQDIVIGQIHNTPIIEWFFSRRFENQNRYNQYILLELDKAIDTSKVAIALHKLIEHHDALRINYNSKTSMLYYNNAHLNESHRLEYVDLSDCSINSRQEMLKKAITRSQTEFDLEKSVLFGITVFDLGNGEQALLWKAHHLVIDGVSWRILLQDFLTMIEQLTKNQEIHLPMKTDSYKDWATQLHRYSRNNFEKQRVYWDAILAKEVSLFKEHKLLQHKSKSEVVLSVELEENLTNAIKRNGYEIYSLDLHEMLITALVLNSSEIMNKNEIVIELEGHGRESINETIDVSRTVGWFTSIYPAYFRLDGDELDHKIKAVKEQLRCIPNNGFDYSIIKYLTHQIIASDLSYIRFNYLGDFDNILNNELLGITNIDFGLESAEGNTITALMDVAALIMNKKLKISITFCQDVFDMETMKRFLSRFTEILKQIVDHCENKSVKEFTPSDFDAADISQEDLDTLF